MKLKVLQKKFKKRLFSTALFIFVFCSRRSHFFIVLKIKQNVYKIQRNSSREV